MMELFTATPAASASASGNSPVDTLPIPPAKARAACDRCHLQKLRCTKERQQINCKRCIRLKTLCRFSPRAPRSVKSTEKPTGIIEDVHYEPQSMPAFTSSTNVHPDTSVGDMDESDWIVPPGSGNDTVEGDQSDVVQEMFWPESSSDSMNLGSLDHNDYAPSDIMPITADTTSCADNVWSLSVSENSPMIGNYGPFGSLRTNSESIVRKLASLSVALDNCAVQLPSMNEKDADSSGCAGHRGRGSRKSKIFAVDELFRLSNDFINILNWISTVEHETSKSINPMQQLAQRLVSFDEQILHRVQVVSQTDTEPQLRSFCHVEETKMLMVVSIHCRLTELYESIFQMIQACLEFSLAPQLGNDWAIVLPNLQVGSFASPPMQVDAETQLSMTTSSMYILMITMVSSQLWDQVASLLKVGHDSPRNSVPAPRWVLTAAVWDTVIARTVYLTQTIAATKHLLQRQSVVLG